MEFFKNWSFCVCITLIISAVFSVFTPQDSMKRFYKTMIALFIFISFIYPLKDFDADIFKDFSDIAGFEISDNMNSVYENEINREVQSFLNGKEISGANISSKVTYDSENDTLEIKEITVFIPDEYDKNEIQKLIFDELGINARVIYLGE